LHALIVEDNQADSWFFSEILRSRGYHVVACSSGEDALRSLEDETPDIVLLDLFLPGIDGLEVCRRIDALDPEGRIPFILVTTSSQEAQALDDVLSAGADDFVRKPVDAATLGIRLDIAERRIREGRDLTSARDALKSKTVEMETLFNKAQEVFFSVDVTEERLIQISPAAKRVFGLDPSDLVGEDAAWRRVLFPPSGDENPWEDLRNNAPGGPLVREYGIQHSERGARWVRASVQIHRDDVSGHVRADGVVVDVTHERGSHKELAAHKRGIGDPLYTGGADSLDDLAQRGLRADPRSGQRGHGLLHRRHRALRPRPGEARLDRRQGTARVRWDAPRDPTTQDPLGHRREVGGSGARVRSGLAHRTCGRATPRP